MSGAGQSRRQFITATGASVLCSLILTGSSLAQPQESIGLIDGAVIQMRQSSETQQQPMTSTAAVRRMCQLMDECVQWGAQADIMVFPNLKNLTLALGGPELEALNCKARALKTCLFFECSLTTKDDGDQAASILMESERGLTWHLKEQAARTLRQTGVASPSATQDFIHSVQLPAAVMDVVINPTDSFVVLVG